MEIGKRLRAIRTQHNMTQQNIADVLGVDRSTYTFYETGTTYPSLRTLYILSQIYNVTVGYLMGVEENRPELIREDGAVNLQEVAEYDPIALLSKDERMIVACFRSFDGETKAEVVEMIKKLAKDHKHDEPTVSDVL